LRILSSFMAIPVRESSRRWNHKRRALGIPGRPHESLITIRGIIPTKTTGRTNRSDWPAGHGVSRTCHGWLRLWVMQVSKPAVQYVTFVTGNITPDAANISSMATVPPKMIHPAPLPACGHGPCLPRQRRDCCMVRAQSSPVFRLIMSITVFLLMPTLRAMSR
jgi:hypothetical protein